MRPTFRHYASLALIVVAATIRPASTAGQEPVPTAPPFKPPVLQPSLGDFLLAEPVAEQKALAKLNPLERPPFAGAPLDGPKGLAAQIKKDELDVPNRIRAVRYLGTLDCVAFPEAQQMLVKTMKEDRFPEVRYEAVLALQVMMSRGVDVDSLKEHRRDCENECCRDATKGRIAAIKDAEKRAKKAETPPCPQNLCELCEQIKAAAAKVVHLPCKVCEKTKAVCRNDCPPEMDRKDFCRGCCDKDTLNALSSVAHDCDEYGCFVEPSAKVRAAAAQALAICGCNQSSPAYYVPPVTTPPPVSPDTPIRPDQPVVPAPPPTEAKQPAASQELRVETPSAAPQPIAGPRTIAGLRGFCVVHLKNREFVPGKPEFASVHDRRIYHFADARAKALFDASPDSYAPMLRGYDPVVLLDMGEMVEGTYLRQHEGRFYLFTSKENWELFKSRTDRYVYDLRSDAVATGPTASRR